MAEPKKRTNNSKQGMRRMHDKIFSSAITHCEKCHEPSVRHAVCKNCGTYKGVQVIDLEKKSKKSEV